MLVQRKNALKMKRSRMSTIFQTGLMVVVVAIAVNWIEVPHLAAQDNETKQLQNELSRLLAEKEELQSRNKEYQARTRELDGMVEKLKNEMVELTEDLSMIRKSQLEQQSKSVDSQNDMEHHLKQTEREKEKLQQQLASHLHRAEIMQTRLRQEIESIRDENRKMRNVIQLHEKLETKLNPTANIDETVSEERPAVSERRDSRKQKDASRDPFSDRRHPQVAEPTRETIAEEDPFIRIGESRQAEAQFVQELRQPQNHSSDLIELAVQYADALAERDIAVIQTERAKSGLEKGDFGKHEFEIAAIQLRAAKRKAGMLRGVAEMTIRKLELDLQSAQSRFKRTEELVEKGYQSKSSLDDHKVEIFKIEMNMELLQRAIRD